MNNHSPTFSIITVTFNSDKTIEDTIKSVLNQTYKNFEYIIVDGGSSDTTLEIINKYSDRINKIVSEKDNGIYDAINKGISIAKNSIVGLLHSDDLFYSKNVLENYSRVFNDKIDLVYSNLIVVKKNKIIRKWRSSKFMTNSFKNGWSPAHPTFFVKKKYFNKYGKYKLNYKIASDIDLMFRFLEIHKLNSHYLDIYSVIMKSGGLSNKNLNNKIKLNIEIIDILKKYYGKNFSIINFILKKFLLKSQQYL